MKLDKNHPQFNSLDGTIVHHNLVADEGAYVTVEGRDSQPMMVVFDMKDLKELAEMHRKLELGSVIRHLPVSSEVKGPMTDEQVKASHRLINRALNEIHSAVLDWVCTVSSPWADPGQGQLASDNLKGVEHQLMQVFPQANDRDFSGD